MTKAKKFSEFVSVVTWVKDQPEFFAVKIHDLATKLRESFKDFEIVIVDRHSSAENRGKFYSFLDKIGNTRFLEPSAKLSQENAFGVGLEQAIGNYIILFSLASDPADIIEKVFEKCVATQQVVVGVAIQDRSFFSSAFQPILLRALRYFNLDFPKNVTHLRGLTRKDATAIVQTLKMRHRLFSRLHHIDTAKTILSYEINRQHLPKNLLRKDLYQFLRTVVSSSTQMLRLVSVMGFTGSFIAFAFASYSILAKIVKQHVIEGWTTSIFFFSFLFMIQFVILAVFGEYLARILDMQSEAQDHAILKEHSSRVMFDEDRLNTIVFENTAEKAPQMHADRSFKG